MVGHRGQVVRGEQLQRVGDHRPEEVGPVALGCQLDGATDRAGAPEGEPQGIGQQHHGRSRRPGRTDGEEPEVATAVAVPAEQGRQYESDGPHHDGRGQHLAGDEELGRSQQAEYDAPSGGTAPLPDGEIVEHQEHQRAAAP